MYFCGMERRIMTFGGYFEAFMKTLDAKHARKFNTDLTY